MGSFEGKALGSFVGRLVGNWVGLLLGNLEGASEGCFVGKPVVGVLVGGNVGRGSQNSLTVISMRLFTSQLSELNRF